MACFWTATASQREVTQSQSLSCARHLHTACTQKCDVLNTLWKGKWRGNLPAGSPLSPVSHRSKFTPGELTHLHFPVMSPEFSDSHWANQLLQPLVVFEFVDGERGQSRPHLPARGPLGPTQRWLPLQHKWQGIQRRVRLRESEEEAKLGLMHNEFLHSTDWDPEGSGNYISILKTLAFLSQFLRKLILEVLLVTKHLEQTLLVPYPECLPLLIGLNNKGTGLLTSHPMPSPLKTGTLKPSQWRLQATAGEIQ